MCIIEIFFNSCVFFVVQAGRHYVIDVSNVKLNLCNFNANVFVQLYKLSSEMFSHILFSVFWRHFHTYRFDTIQTEECVVFYVLVYRSGGGKKTVMFGLSKKRFKYWLMILRQIYLLISCVWSMGTFTARCHFVITIHISKGNYHLTLDGP